MANRGRKDGLKLRDEELEQLQGGLDDWKGGATKAALIKEARKREKGHWKTAIYDLFRTGDTCRRTLTLVAEILDLDFPRLLPQLYFEFQITHDFIEDARQALGPEPGPIILRGVLHPHRNSGSHRPELRISRTSERGAMG